MRQQRGTACPSSANLGSGPVLLVSSTRRDRILRVSQDTDNVCLQPACAGTNPYCSWLPLGNNPDFAVHRPGEAQRHGR